MEDKALGLLGLLEKFQTLGDGGAAAVCVGRHVIQSLAVVLVLQLTEELRP